MNTLEQHIAFIKEAEGLKSVLRTSWSSAGRPESTAEHSWRLTLLTALFLKDFPTLDPRRTLLTALIHDLGELYDGDISAALLPDENVKLDMERKAVHRLFSLLPDEDRNFFLQLWEDYNAAATPEARLIKALDKAETIIQHNQGKIRLTLIIPLIWTMVSPGFRILPCCGNSESCSTRRPARGSKKTILPDSTKDSHRDISADRNSLVLPAGFSREIGMSYRNRTAAAPAVHCLRHLSGALCGSIWK